MTEAPATQDAAAAPGIASPDPEDRLRALTGAFFDFAMEYPAFVDCAQTLMRRPGPTIRNARLLPGGIIPAPAPRKPYLSKAPGVYGLQNVGSNDGPISLSIPKRSFSRCTAKATP